MRTPLFGQAFIPYGVEPKKQKNGTMTIKGLSIPDDGKPGKTFRIEASCKNPTRLYEIYRVLCSINEETRLNKRRNNKLIGCLELRPNDTYGHWVNSVSLGYGTAELVNISDRQSYKHLVTKKIMSRLLRDAHTAAHYVTRWPQYW